MPNILTSDALSAGHIVREPVGHEPGYWAGAPGAFFEPDEEVWYLTYRLRRPRGIEPDRGGEARICRSTDLVHWQDIWSVTKDKFHSASIERCALRKGPDGQWHYFASYVDPADGRWCVSMIKAGRIEELDPAKAVPVFKAAQLGLEGIKDPWIFHQDTTFSMFLSVALPTARTTAKSHGSLDIFNTGECLSATGLATSRDLEDWDWQGIVFAPETPAWDGYCRRINSIVRFDGTFLGFYDGSASSAENYEEKTAVATSSDLRHWRSLNPTQPLLTSPHASGSLRYLDAQVVGERVCVFYEFGRPDGSHDLRLHSLSWSELKESLMEIKVDD